MLPLQIFLLEILQLEIFHLISNLSPFKSFDFLRGFPFLFSIVVYQLNYLIISGLKMRKCCQEQLLHDDNDKVKM